MSDPSLRLIRYPFLGKESDAAPLYLIFAFKLSTSPLVLSKNLYKSDKGRSASALVRANEVNQMFKSNDIDLILCAAGGQFLIEILPFLYHYLIFLLLYFYD